MLGAFTGFGCKLPSGHENNQGISIRFMRNPIVGVFVIGFYGCTLLRVTSFFLVLMLSSWRAQSGHGFNIGDTAIPQSPGVVFYARSCISGCKDKCIRTVMHPNVFRVRSVKIVL